jgi:L-histidine Nalpha-methyltransferase
MSTSAALQLSRFGADVQAGLVRTSQKKLSPTYFYDDLGSKLFEAITVLPEYGCTRADERILARCAPEVAAQLGSRAAVAELGSGSGRKTSHILSSLRNRLVGYFPIDVSNEALSACCRELAPFGKVSPIHGDYADGLRQLIQRRPKRANLLLLFLGSTIGNFERAEQVDFLQNLRSSLSPGDLFLIGTDLVKDVERMLNAYDDPTGVTASFNLNLLGRINRELDADFDLRSFSHEARWNENERRIEMHLVSSRTQRVHIAALEATINVKEGESIWTESSHKFTVDDLQQLAESSGFTPIQIWTDSEWPFAESLWRA